MKKNAFIILEHPKNDGNTIMFDKLMNFIKNQNYDFDIYVNENLSYINRGMAILKNYFKLKKNLKNYSSLIIESKKDTYLLIFLLRKKINKYNVKIKLLHIDIHNEFNPHFDTSTKYMNFLEKRILKISNIVYFMNEEHYDTYKNYEIPGEIRFNIFVYYENLFKNKFSTTAKKIIYAGLLDKPRLQILEKFAKELFKFDEEYVIEVFGNDKYSEKASSIPNIIFNNFFIDITNEIQSIQRNYCLFLSISVATKMFPSKLRSIYSYDMPFLNLTEENFDSSLEKEVEYVGGYYLKTSKSMNLDFLNSLKKPENITMFSYDFNKEKILKMFLE